MGEAGKGYVVFLSLLLVLYLVTVLGLAVYALMFSGY